MIIADGLTLSSANCSGDIPCPKVLKADGRPLEIIVETAGESTEQVDVLVIGAETLSRIVDWSDRLTCVLFGDGAGAFKS